MKHCYQISEKKLDYALAIIWLKHTDSHVYKDICWARLSLAEERS